MKSKLWRLIPAVIFLVAACGQTPATESAIPTENIQPTTLPSATAQPSQTTTPISTNIPTTQTVTPLPTIPTFTPTFDTRTIVTVTPASPAQCPESNPGLIPDFKIPTKNDRIFIGTEKDILDFLNKGGTLKSVVDRLNGNGNPIIQDITGDNISELTFVDFGAMGRLHVFMCNNGLYKLFSPMTDFPNPDFYWMNIEEIKDMDGNGLKDIVTIQRGCSGSGCFKVSVISWDGNNFIDVAPSLSTVGLLDLQLTDIDHDDVADISLHTSQFTCCIPGEYPKRVFTDIFKWNGKTFEYSESRNDPPIFRFQAVQDADQYVLSNDFDNALASYQDVIFSDKLEWWSEKRAEFTWISLQYSPPSLSNMSPPPMDPIPDDINFEYNSLAAYSYYRISLLHLVRGYESDAGTVYNTLQQKFGADPNGRPYAEMATAFWNVYQSTHKMYDGCAAAIHYADEHPEILIPLGSDYHGMQSHTYVPADVCPFR
jgi:hypothetical protein